MVVEAVRSAIAEAWQKSCEEYGTGYVNSECTMQAIIFAELRSNLSNYRVMCEPRFVGSDLSCYVPDIVVLNDECIVAIMELKFVPHGYPQYQRDLEKLGTLVNWAGDLKLRTNAETGKFSEFKFRVSEDAVPVFCVIGKYDANAIDKEKLFSSAAENIREKLLPLVYKVGRPFEATK